MLWGALCGQGQVELWRRQSDHLEGETTGITSDPALILRSFQTLEVKKRIYLHLQPAAAARFRGATQTFTFSVLIL